MYKNNNNISQVYSEKTDIWAFGITMLEILTREKPYGDKNPLSVVTEGILNKKAIYDVSIFLFIQFIYFFELKIVSFGKLVPNIPDFVNGSVAELLKSCFEFDPHSRPNFKKIANIAESIKSIVSTF